MTCNKSCILRSLLGLLCVIVAVVGTYIFLGGYYYKSSQGQSCWVTNTTNCHMVNENADGYITFSLKDNSNYTLETSHVFCESNCCQVEQKNNISMICLFRQGDLQNVIYHKLDTYYVTLFYAGIAMMMTALVTGVVYLATRLASKQKKNRDEYPPIIRREWI